MSSAKVQLLLLHAIPAAHLGEGCCELAKFMPNEWRMQDALHTHDHEFTIPQCQQLLVHARQRLDRNCDFLSAIQLQDLLHQLSGYDRSDVETALHKLSRESRCRGAGAGAG